MRIFHREWSASARRTYQVVQVPKESWCSPTHVNLLCASYYILANGRSYDSDHVHFRSLYMGERTDPRADTTPKLHVGRCRIFNRMIPKLIYDDDCHFCTWSATFTVRRSNIQPVRLSRVQEGKSRLSDDERDRLPDGYEKCAQLITEDAVYSCGAATEQSLVIAGVLPEKLVEFLRQFEDYERLREAVYHFTSDHRDIISNIVGRDPPVSQHVSEDDIDPKKQTR